MKEWLQNIVPQHLLSRLMGKLANARAGIVTRCAIKLFISHYQVNMSEALESDYTAYKSFNDFFTRELKPGARPITSEEAAIISPADGSISEIGYAKKNDLLQAKGAYFSLRDLCGGDEALSSCFADGAFMTAYLSPKDYHRFHMPIDGRLLEMIYVPGKLFSVNESSVQHVPGLFARNERVICLFETEIGKVAVIAVGAMIVGSVEMKWHGIVAPQSSCVCQSWDYEDQSIELKRGDEMGRFRLGSTVIVLTEKDKVIWDESLRSGGELKMGQVLGQAKPY